MKMFFIYSVTRETDDVFCLFDMFEKSSQKQEKYFTVNYLYNYPKLQKIC